ncbi:MAG: membrane protein insertion efficiency factor YidD [Candidatus Xenobia bacterium]
MSLSDVAIRGYQKYISRDYNADNHAHCMYYPTCSEYVKERMEDDGFWRGGIQGALRLLRCQTPVRDREKQLFLGEVAHHAADVAVDGPASQQVLDRLQAVADQETVLASQAQSTQRLHELREERQHLLSSVELATVDLPPDREGKTHPHFVLRQPVNPSEPRSVHANLLKKAAMAVTGSVVATAGALLGAVGFGLAGAVVGVTLGVASKHVDAHVPADSKVGFAAIEKPITRIPNAIEKHLHSHLLAATVGLWAGLGAGAGMGVLTGAGVGMRMGWLLGKNLMADALGVLPPYEHPHLHPDPMHLETAPAASRIPAKGS